LTTLAKANAWANKTIIVKVSLMSVTNERQNIFIVQATGFVLLTHRDTTRVQMLSKMFPHLKLLFWLFIGPTLGFDT
jgi:hypothetical protein